MKRLARSCGISLATWLAGLMLVMALPVGNVVLAASVERRITIRDGHELVVVVRKLIAAGEYDAARQVIRAWHPTEATYPYRVRYVEGLIEKAKGNYPQAIAVFRDILAERPDFTFVRLDLANTLYLAKDDEAAKYQAGLLIAAGVDDQIGGGLKTMVGDIDSRRPVRFRGFFSLLPSSNLNSGTDKEVIYVGGLPFVIDSGQRRKSGVGVVAGGEVLLRHQINDRVAAVGSASLVARMYPSIGRVDLSVDASAGVETRFDRGVMTLSLIGKQDFADMDSQFRSYGGQVEGSRYVGESGRVYGNLAVTMRDYLGSEVRDGWRAELAGSYDYFIDPSRFVRLLGGAIYEDAKDDAFSFTELSAGLGMYSEIAWGVTAYVQGLYAQRNYQAPMAVFGVRKDDRFEAQVTLTKRDLVLYGLAPQVTYSFVRNISTSPFDDYSAHGVNLRFVRDF